MSKFVVLAEKPSVGRDIARVLGCLKKGNGFFEGDKYIVTWALGHLVTLADPEAYDPRYAQWRIEDLPMLPKNLKLEVIKKTSAQYRCVKEQMLRKDVSDIIIATDAGREGELVARWIIEKIGLKKPIKRLWISSVTDKAIKDGFASLKDGRSYESLYASAYARSAADWYVGINATRALTTKHNAQLSCGRVQTPTLAMIALRESEIQAFRPEIFYGLTAQSDVVLTWFDKASGSAQSFSEERIQSLQTALKGQNAKVAQVDKAHKKQSAPPLYDLTELQRDANKRFGYSAKETLNIMQRLYEQHKVLTYPRTDSRFISTDIVESIKDRLKACGVGPYTSLAFKISKTPIKAQSHFVDDKKVSDHHAIIPTEERPLLSTFSNEERKIYDLVVRRFLAVLLPPFEYEETSLTATIGSEHFRAKGKRIINQGWKEAYDNDYEDDVSEGGFSAQIPALKVADPLTVKSLKVTKGVTSPPPLFTEGTLLTAMEKPGKFLDASQKDLAKILGETGGIGTVATRADIIEKLLSSFLIEKKGKALQITSKGKQLLSLVPEDLKSPALTAKWETELERIAKSKQNKETFVKEIMDYASLLVKDIKEADAKFKHDNMTRDKCPECGKYMLAVNGKKGKMLVCQDRECGYRKGVSRTTNARCPNCHKKLELRGEGDNQIFVCVCGHKEKMEAFKKRRENAPGKTNMAAVKKMLEEQNKETETLSPLAEALAKLKL